MISFRYSEFGQVRSITYYISLIYWVIILGFCLFWTYEQVGCLSISSWLTWRFSDIHINWKVDPPTNINKDKAWQQWNSRLSCSYSLLQEQGQTGLQIEHASGMFQHVSVCIVTNAFITLQHFNLTGYWKNEDTGRYYNDTWKNFAWGRVPLTELWNTTTYWVVTKSHLFA